MITITPVAVDQLRELLAGKGLEPDTHGLRLGVERGGCAGMQYTMKVGTAEDGDQVVESQGVRVFLDSESLPYLENSELDYVDDLSDAGFRINNPNASRSCGCGTSFETAGQAAEGQP